MTDEQKQKLAKKFSNLIQKDDLIRAILDSMDLLKDDELEEMERNLDAGSSPQFQIEVRS